MNLGASDKVFIVTGVGSGFGKAITARLAEEGAEVLAISRSHEKLLALQEAFPSKITALVGDVTHSGTAGKLLPILQDKTFGGLVYAGGPPAKSALECSIDDFDEAYRSLFR